eukprot:TRINITY_DN7101_c0_g1_i1.p1 TRINITY_DN7101_c0_g1~~TRINITY_DN7101_c0_g1_i1.p1  ORF type:complete len:327 (-),score=29.74 TRINITY_DN7101_c0_g1_i1:40-1020(-)
MGASRSILRKESHIELEIGAGDVSLETTEGFETHNRRGVPDDVFCSIFTVSTKMDLARASSTCKTWRRLVFQSDSEFTTMRATGITRYPTSREEVTTKSLNIPRFSQCLAVNKFWRRVCLNTNLLDSSTVSLLGEALVSNTTLTALDIGDNNISSGLPIFFQNIAKNHILRRLSIWSTGITDSDMKSLCPGLKLNKSLTHLDVSTNKFSDKGYKCLASAITEMSAARAAAKSGLLFQSLVCKENTTTSPESWMSSLLSVPSLTFLNLNKVCQVQTARFFAQALAECLPTTKLKTLMIQRNNLRDEGLVVMKALMDNKELTHIDSWL